jgi:uroporphyrinogen III methyltransferase/synthase
MTEPRDNQRTGASALHGRRILVTRAADQAPELINALAARGAEPVVVPTIQLIAPSSYAELDRAIADLDTIDYLVLTSVNAVDFFFRRLSALGHDPAILKGVQIVAVGPKSAAALSAYDIQADLVPEDYRAEGIVALLKDRVSGKRVLYPKAALARELIPAELTKAGAEVIAPTAYASHPPDDAQHKLRQALAEGLDLLTFTASSTVDNFTTLLDEDSLDLARQVPVASIGPLTTATAKEHGFNVVIEPDNSTLDDMVEAITQHFAQQ